MATPNLANVATIKPVMKAGVLSASAVDLCDVPAESCMKIESIYVANVDGTSAADVSVKVVKAAFTSAATGAAGNVGTIYLAKTISVPADASLVLLDTPIYMQEGDALQGGASASSDLEIFVSYDVIA